MFDPQTSKLVHGLIASFAFALTVTTARANDAETTESPEPAPTSPWFEGMTNVVSQLNVSLYGSITADATYDTATLSGGDTADFVTQGSANDGQFHMTARQTRLGLNIAGPDSGTVISTARIEVDFYGGTEPNSTTPRMRHAYLDLDFPSQDVSVRAGQTSDVVSPLVPSTLNYQAGFNQGDIGFQRNQIRITKGYNLAANQRVLMAAAATRATGSESVGRPGVQGRMGITFDGFGGQPTTIGVPGHEAPTPGLLSSRSVCADLVIPLGKRVKFQGEYYEGRNLASYLGGLAAGPTNADTSGFWAALGYEASSNWTFNGGYALDDPEIDDVATGEMTSNARIWTNANYAIDSATTVGIEVAEHTTGYKDTVDEQATRFQLALTFTF